MSSSNESFWRSPLYSSGFTMGLGIGFVSSMVAVQMPNDFIGRVGMILLAAGVVVFVSGSLRLRGYLSRNSSDK